MGVRTKIIALCVVAIVVAVAVWAGYRAAENSDVSNDIVIVQSNGEEITINATKGRIIAMSLNVAEVLYGIGAADKVVGLSDTCLTHDEIGPLFAHVATKGNVGDFQNPSIDVITSLNPDVLITYTAESQTNLATLQTLGIPIIQIECSDTNIIPRDIQNLGKITGCTEKANELSGFITNIFETVKAANKDIPTTNVVFFGLTGTTSIMGGGSPIDDAIAIAGGTNLASNVITGTATVDVSWLLAQDIDFMFKRVTSSTWANTAEKKVDAIKNADGYNAFDAVKNNHVYALLSNLVSGPRIFGSVIILGELFNPGGLGTLTFTGAMEDYNELMGTHFITDLDKVLLSTP